MQKGGKHQKYNLPSKGEYKIFANIPYFITTQIIDKLTQAPNPPADIWLVMEKGAAKRFMGSPKETNGICGKGGPLTKRQVSVALKQAGLPHAHEDGVTLYIQWLCLFRCYRRTFNNGK